MQRGRGTKKTDQTIFWYQFVAMGLVLFLSYLGLTTVFYGYGLVTDGVDLLDPESRDIERLGLYVWPFDQGLADFSQDVGVLLDSYMAKQNIFTQERERVDRVWSYIATHHTGLTRRGFSQYSELFDALASLYPHRDEVYKLLGSEQPFSYMIVLQNTGEKRANGGFFGSFVLLTIDQGQIVTFQPVDSYFPDSIAPKFRLEGPERGYGYLDNNQIGFVAANKYGFTDIDGRHLKLLYEKIFNEKYDRRIVDAGPYRDVWPVLHDKYIKGVVFLRSDMWEDVIPDFDQKVWEWQFVNATIDLIRGEDRGNKKELYMSDMTDYFEKHRTQLMLAILRGFGSIQDKHQINVYLSNVSDGLQSWLRDQQLVTKYDEDSVYLWDFNRTYSKVDRFVTKEVIVRRDGMVVGEYVNDDIISAAGWESGYYVVDIYYHLNIPQKYFRTIDRLVSQYDVILGERENMILHMQPNTQGDLWATQGLIHLPLSWTLHDVSGDIGNGRVVFSPFSRVVTYTAQTPLNNSTSKVSLTFTISQ